MRCLWIAERTLISPRFDTVQGKVQFLGGRLRSENLHRCQPAVSVEVHIRSPCIIRKS